MHACIACITFTSHTLPQVRSAEADDYFVFVVSDANLRRYGIEPKRLGQLLSAAGQGPADKRVNAHAIFIASIGDEADTLRRALPAGKGHVCLDTSGLPALLKRLFTASLWGSQ